MNKHLETLLRTVRRLDDLLEVVLVGALRLARRCTTQWRWGIAAALFVYWLLPFCVSVERFHPPIGEPSGGAAGPFENPIGSPALTSYDMRRARGPQSNFLTREVANARGADEVLWRYVDTPDGDRSEFEATLDRLAPDLARVGARIREAHDFLESGGTSPLVLGLDLRMASLSQLTFVLRVLAAEALRQTEHGRPEAALGSLATGLELMNLLWGGVDPGAGENLVPLLAHSSFLKRMLKAKAYRGGSGILVDRCLTLLARSVQTREHLSKVLVAESNRAASIVGTFVYNHSAVRAAIPGTSFGLVCRLSTSQRGDFIEALRDRIHAKALRLAECLEGDVLTIERRTAQAEKEIAAEERVSGGLALAWELARAAASSSYRGDLLARWICLENNTTLTADVHCWLQVRRNASALAYGLAIERFRAKNGHLPASLADVVPSVPAEVQAILDPGAVRYQRLGSDYTLESTTSEKR